MQRVHWHGARVQWYSAGGIVVQCRGYSGTEQTVRWYGIGVQGTDT